MGPRLGVVLLLWIAFGGSFSARAQRAVDSDKDGLPDAVEQRLLEQFAPTLMLDPGDCSKEPARFVAGLAVPMVEAEDMTLYGEASPVSGGSAEHPRVELRYFHLWRTDCGPRGHALDTEHVSVLVEASGAELRAADWHARYWYAAAHEDTVCDVSEIARAPALKAEDGGAAVWVSSGKHASFLSERMCEHGCGNDVCSAGVARRASRIVNLGEAGRPMNGSVFVSSAEWPLAAKMERTDFPAEALARVDALPAAEIALFHAGRHPAQGVIAVSSTTAGAIGVGAGETGAALDTADVHTSNALDTATSKTGHALGKSARATARFLHLTPSADAADAAGSSPQAQGR